MKADAQVLRETQMKHPNNQFDSRGGQAALDARFSREGKFDSNRMAMLIGATQAIEDLREVSNLNQYVINMPCNLIKLQEGWYTTQVNKGLEALTQNKLDKLEGNQWVEVFCQQ